MSYYDIYKKRLSRENRKVTARTRRDKLEIDRRANFESFLYGSPHYVRFPYMNSAGDITLIEGVFEPHQQNQTRSIMQLLCRADEVEFEIGSVVEINERRYMFFYWNDVENSGYNKWTLVHMNKEITWLNKNKELCRSFAYLYYQEDNMLKNELRSRSRSDTLYLENLKLNFLLMPFHKDMTPTTYMEIESQGVTQAFRVTGIDIVSTPGAIYVSMDPTYNRGNQEIPIPQDEDPMEEYFWLQGGGDSEDKTK